MSKVVVYEGNSAVITYTVTNPDGTAANLSGFTATLYVKEDKETSSSALITKTGVIVSNEVTFTILATDNTMAKATYFYEVVLTSASQVLTIAQDRYIVRESIVYIT
jgi:hypothetical protein